MFALQDCLPPRPQAKAAASHESTEMHVLQRKFFVLPQVAEVLLRIMPWPSKQKAGDCCMRQPKVRQKV
jgi:hypothetical protein